MSIVMALSRKKWPFIWSDRNFLLTFHSHLLCWSILFCAILTQVRLGENDIILVNRPIDVPFGRKVTIDPVNHLKIHVSPGDTCEISVKDSYTLVDRPGALNLQSFPCAFGPSQLTYTHFGGKTSGEERISLLLRYDSNTDTVIIPLSLTFIITPKPLNIVKKNLPLKVIKSLGVSSPMDENALEFYYDERKSTCSVSVLNSASGLMPRYGYVLNSTSTLSSIDCDIFLTLAIRYKHTHANSPNIDHIPLFVKLYDIHGHLFTEEHFFVTVNIVPGKPNTRPEPSQNALFVMDSVNQFIMTAITSEIISAVDNESPLDKLIFNITFPLGPGEGLVVNTDDQNTPITSFYQHDINNLKIAYKPPASDSSIKRVYQLELTILDPEGLKSDPIPLMVVVEPKNTFAPIVTTNRGIQLVEGESRPIASPDVLEIADEDNLDDVKIYHVDGLRHGHLLLPPGRKYFTAGDLKSGSVIYQHDDSDTYSDNIIFRMTDGNHNVEFLFPVIIYPKDDRPPILNVNTGLEVQKNGIVEVNQLILSSTDPDSDDSKIKFILDPPYSKEGILIKRQFHTPDDVQSWQYQNGVYEKFVNEFTQTDILEEKLFYRHVGNKKTEEVLDKIVFHLADSAEPPNKSPPQEMLIKILPVDDQPPYLYSNIKLQMEIEETELVHFRRKNFRYTDDDSNDRELHYTITRQPYDTYTAGPLDAGYICYCEDQGYKVSVFTQSEINHHKICYHPPSAELGLTTRIIQFDFTVEDTAGNTLPNQRFTLIVKPINNQPPMITNKGATVYENGETVITPQVLDVTDPDTEADALNFILTKVPDHGILYKRQMPLQAGDSFRLIDVAQGIIVYQNLGENVEITEDQFSLDVTDGLHILQIVFRITVQPVDDEVPVFEGTMEKISYEVNEGGSLRLDGDRLRVSDQDTNSEHLTYTITKQPKSGVLLRNRESVAKFSHRDILRGMVEYEHTGGEIGLNQIEDRFELLLTDTESSVVSDTKAGIPVNVTIKIIPRDNKPPVVTVGPPLDVFEGDKAALLPFHVDVHDIDTNDTILICTILIQPENGYLENIAPLEGSEKTQSGKPVSAFSVHNIRVGNINYVQSVHKGIEPRQDDFTIQCSDGINLSAQKRLNIVIHPANDEEPEVHVREFTGSEGMEIRIDLPILNALDSDEPPDDLNFIITQKPDHGIIKQQSRYGDTPITNFSLNDIKDFSTIVYEHDDSETRSDQFQFILTDGKHNVSKTVPIIIFPIDDETPRLVVNNGLEIEKIGDRKLITNKELRADDVDSFIPNITFIIRTMPKQGYLLKTVKAVEVNLTSGSNFTQDDLDNHRVAYVCTIYDGKRDLIKFDVTDGLNPLVDRHFYVSMAGFDTIYPEVINKGVTLPEGGIVILTTDLLSGSDINSPDENLKYTVTNTPKYGYLDFSDNDGVPITTFTQLDLAANRVRYIHIADNEFKMDRFEFELTDGFNPVMRTFRIYLTDIDNKKPVLMFAGLRLKEGSNKLITPFELNALDQDTTHDKLVFSIIQVPLHGNLLFNYSRIVSLFTQKDLTQNLISYQHDGTETVSDSFTFTVTDGTHSDFFVSGLNLPTRRPQEMEIEIVPVDNGFPQISVNKGGTMLAFLEDGEIGFQFTKLVLRSDDHDTPVDSLHFTLTSPPAHGFLRNTKTGYQPVITWTQGEIDRGQIQYVLNPGENATSDSFFFKVTDQGGNVLANQPFHLNWAWVSFVDSEVKVNETAEKLEVRLRRRGYLGETCFVTLSITGETARVGDDLSKRYAEQVQFNPGQTDKTWSIRLRDDSVYEKSETLVIQLTDPVFVVLEYPDSIVVTILDPEDESTVFFAKSEFEVDEKVGQLQIPIYRTGDLSQELTVICYTEEGSATGTPPNKVVSFSDYISRAQDHTSIVRFASKEDNKNCGVSIIDDSLYEEKEKFKVILAQPMGGRLGGIVEAEVTIIPDQNDEPVFYFDESEYMVDESAGELEVKVWKTGTDLSRPSSVTVRSRQLKPVSAESGLDYTAVNRILDFAPGEMTKTLMVTILDDLGQPRLEGLEKFDLVLRMPMGGSLGEPSVAVVSINDSLSDIPKMEFLHSDYEVLETEGQVVAIVTRSGDINQMSKVRCYTRQASAEVMVDYVERPDTNASFIEFLPGEREKECRVDIVNDPLYEGDESFRLVLGTPVSSTAGAATLGGQNTAKVVIHDFEDAPVIKFEQNRYTVNEPIIKGDVNILRIPVIRLGDISGTSEVRVSTKSGSARAGRDFNGYSRALQFSPGVKRLYAEIEINYDTERENSEVFSVHLSQDRFMIAEVKYNDRALIYVEENSRLADVIFPVPPIVVSLRDYNDVAGSAQKLPVQGYPLVCVSPCNPKHPQFPVVGQFCVSDGIDDSLTKFRWRVAAPNGITADLKDLETNTFFTNTRSISLDSIYFEGGSRVQCYARAVNMAGEPGKELGSTIITVHKTEGLCQSPGNTVGADPFTARLRYTGSSDPAHPNTIKVSVMVPHRDGLLPIISTTQLTNFDLTLSQDGFRLGQHRCSNLLNFDETPTRYGFPTNVTTGRTGVREVEPYQFDTKLRTEPTLRFYRNLDQEYCLWTFEGYFDMSELVTQCRGQVITDAEVLNVKQSYVSLQVPLYVSYVYYSPTLGWRHFDLDTKLNLKFVYDTSILWQEGISSSRDEDGLYGYLFPTSMRLQEDSKLVVNFRTEPRFRGQFVLRYTGTSLVSEVTSDDHPDMTFALSLISTTPTFDQSEQTWEFVSNMALKDYSGMYKVKLLPCTATLSQSYSVPVVCNPGQPVTFDLPIRFQQISDPVPAEYNLDTEFRLMRKRDLWLSEKSEDLVTAEEASFAPGDLVFGRIDVSPLKRLGGEFDLGVEKVFLCSGKDGYLPKYAPEKGEYGCLENSRKLQQVFRILDKGAPHSIDESYNGVPFRAVLAKDDVRAARLVHLPGADGFSFDSAPLFKVNSGQQWFLHTIYKIHSKDTATQDKRKRDAEHYLFKRTISDVSDIGHAGVGTNMAPLFLNFYGKPYEFEEDNHSDSVKEQPNGQMNLIAILVGVGVLLLLCGILAIVFIRQRQKRTSPPPSPAGTITIVSGGKSR